MIPRVLLLTSSLLTDRMFMYSNCLKSLAAECDLHIWATSARKEDLAELWARVWPEVRPFPKIRAYKEFPYNLLRRLNDFAWDYRHKTPSRRSINLHVREKEMPLTQRLLKGPAWGVAALGAEAAFESGLERLLTSYSRSAEAYEQLQMLKPDVLVTTGPFQFEQPAIVGEARRLGIPILCMIPSWDNLSTKNRMVFDYDGYLLWSKRSREELHELYPGTLEKPVYIVGASQFDVFFRPEFEMTREEFCSSQGLDPKRPIVLNGIGSPNMFREEHCSLQLAEQVTRGNLGNAQLLVRPHPIHDHVQMKELFKPFTRDVVLQRTGDSHAHVTMRSQSENDIREWVSTFRHSDVVVNLSSTVTIDAAICDKPVVNLDFDPQPGQPNQAFVKDVNHVWSHFKPIAESGGLWLAQDMDDVIKAINAYLANPKLHAERRRWMAEFVCGYIDGRCGERLGAAISEFARMHVASGARRAEKPAASAAGAGV